MPRLRTTHASVRTTLTRLALAATAAALTVGGLTPSPAGADGTTPSVPAERARVAKQLFTNPVTPGTYTGLGFRSRRSFSSCGVSRVDAHRCSGADVVQRRSTYFGKNDRTCCSE